MFLALSLINILMVHLCVGSEEMDLAVSFLENLTKVPRFDILVMCLTSTDRAGTTSCRKVLQINAMLDILHL